MDQPRLRCFPISVTPSCPEIKANAFGTMLTTYRRLADSEDISNVPDGLLVLFPQRLGIRVVSLFHGSCLGPSQRRQERFAVFLFIPGD